MVIERARPTIWTSVYVDEAVGVGFLDFNSLMPCQSKIFQILLKQALIAMSPPINMTVWKTFKPNQAIKIANLLAKT